MWQQTGEVLSEEKITCFVMFKNSMCLQNELFQGNTLPFLVYHVTGLFITAQNADRKTKKF